MRVRIRKLNKDGMARVETKGKIMEVLINEDFMKPDKETIAVCFRGRDSSGIIDFSPEEMEKLMNTVNQRMRLIKGMKKVNI